MGRRWIVFTSNIAGLTLFGAILHQLRWSAVQQNTSSQFLQLTFMRHRCLSDYFSTVAYEASLGIDRDSPNEARGLGLISMKERVKALNGTFSIKSQPNCGQRPTHACLCDRKAIRCERQDKKHRSLEEFTFGETELREFGVLCRSLFKATQ